MNKKILIIEDEVSLRNVLTDKFKMEGLEVLEAKNGKSGLEIACKEHPNLILLDIVMPVMDGLTMLKKLREDNWGKNVKVIMLTNLSESEKTAEAFEGGSYDYLVKSDWKIADVVRKVKKALE